jgi:hypothetical protein
MSWFREHAVALIIVVAGVICAALGVWIVELQRELVALEEAHRAEDAAAVATSEVDRQVEAATQTMGVAHADEVRAIEQESHRVEKRLRARPDDLSLFLVEQGRAAIAAADAGP